MKIAIIGAGISGLLCAYRLSQDFEVTIFEKENYPGGLCSQACLDNKPVDKYNHFFSRYDTEIIEVINELRLSGNLVFKKVRQGSIMNGKLFNMRGPLSLFAMPGINIMEKIKLAAFLMQVSVVNDGLQFNKQTVREWIEDNCSKNVFERYFKPMLEFKFQNYKDVSAGYLWARIKEGKQNEIGFLSGGMEVLSKCLFEQARGKGAEIILNKSIRRIEKTEKNKWLLYSDGYSTEFNFVICCISLKEAMRLFDEEFKNTLNIPEPEYLNVGSYILKLKKPLSKKYWLYVLHKQNVRPNVIINASPVTGDNIVYFPAYKRTDAINGKDRENIFNNCMSALRVINRNFDKTWVEEKIFHSDTLVEPVLTNKFIDQVSSGSGGVDGLYFPEAIYERHLLKTVNTQAINAKFLYKEIMGRNE